MMNNLFQLFNAVASGEITPAQAELSARELLANPKSENLGFAQIDHDRAQRCGFAEVVFAQGKTKAQVLQITGALLERNPRVLITRTSAETAQALLRKFPDADHNQVARTVLAGAKPAPRTNSGLVLVICAGTSDLPVAQEARVTAAAMGCRVRLIADVGVAGIHRLLAHQQLLQEAAVIVVVAGMEGALPSVVGGLVMVPVIAVPTSIGYGASFGGIAALLGMLNSCAAGVSVVNIDNGFGGGAVAARIALSGSGPHSNKEQE